MTKRFYSERDIEDLVRSGAEALEIGDDTVLTELAYEKAKSLGLKLTRDIQTPPSAPVRPYLSNYPQTRVSTAPVAPAAAPTPQPADSTPEAPQKTTNLEDRIHSSVIARMGDQIDPVLLNNIIARVVKNVGGR